VTRPLAVLPALSLLLLALALAAPNAARGQEPEQEPEMILPAGGIRYPGGYDPNTVGVVEGRVASFSRPERGPVTFRLEGAAETFTVLAAPVWYWDGLKLAVRDGDRLRVKGSKSMGADGNLYLVVQELAPAGGERPVVLREPGGKPLWSGCGPQGCGKRAR